MTRLWASPAHRCVWGMALLALLAAALAGCGSSVGIAALTGGGVPAGRAALEGTVVGALDPGQPVADAEVTLQVDAAPPASPYTMTTHTDSAGAFSFANVPEGEATVQVTPPAALFGRPYSGKVQLHAGDTASVAVAIEPIDATLAVASLTVSPEAIDAVVGIPVDLTVTALLTNGHEIRPSMMVEGGVGRISRGGRFMPMRAGTGQIRVRAGDQERIVPVVIHSPAG